MTAPAERLFVIASTYQRFLYWCQENRIPPRGRHVAFVGENDPGRLFLGAPRGLRYLVVSWPLRSSSAGILEALYMTEAAEITDEELAVWLEAVRMPDA